ncbi:pancreatic alpha-amylase-like [Liolophura sinensis]|uniref:pancreatic alpha-amylase-like n=1 Tax=Liolophura sinensis TaxID=3198878 RepID=UPI003158B683
MWLTIALLIGSGCLAGAQHSTNCPPGRHVIAHLFEWRWTDIAVECERFLGPTGYCGVQISPPNEHRIIPEINFDIPFSRFTPITRPWYERYQPVSYKLTSRSGTEEELRDMIRRCNDVNVRIYVDAVINHMAGENAYGTGSAGSIWNSASLSFPGVPFSEHDFHSGCGIENYGDAYQVQNCRLVGLVDLDLGKDYVRGKIADYLNKLTAMGVAGFRLDASKHMHPNDLMAIRAKLHNLNTTYFPADSKPFIYQEVIDMGGEGISSSQYVGVGRVTEFKYGKELARFFRGNVQLKHLSGFGESWGMVHSNNAVVFVDNHDNQRGHGGGGNILTFRDSRLYKMANAFMLAWPYGFTRVMSSYSWPTHWERGKDKNDWIGPPASGNRVQNTLAVTITAQGECTGDWICEHRWRQIANMVAFRNSVTGQGVDNWWDNGANQVAFGRGDKGFLAINNDGFCMVTELDTGLPAGTYCDVISGEFRRTHCTGRVVRVGHDGKALMDVANWLPDPVLAIHAGSRISDSVSHGAEAGTPDLRRTVILIEKQTTPGQDIFMRGGIDHARRPVCKQNPVECAIPVRYRPIGTGSHYQKYIDWCKGDQMLDWEGAESGQGKYENMSPHGSPLVWTTNDVTSSAYQSVNSYGGSYWLLDVDMDCSKTENGWFEVKAVIASRNGTEVTWESNLVHSSANPAGSARETLPGCSANHIVKCGKINVLKFGRPDIKINNFS